MGGGNFSGHCAYSLARYCHLCVHPPTHTRRELLPLRSFERTVICVCTHTLHTYKEGTPAVALTLPQVLSSACALHTQGGNSSCSCPYSYTCCCLHAPLFSHLPNKHFLLKDVQLQAQLDQQSLSQQVTETQEGLISLEFREG